MDVDVPGNSSCRHHVELRLDAAAATPDCECDDVVSDSSPLQGNVTSKRECVNNNGATIPASAVDLISNRGSATVTGDPQERGPTKATTPPMPCFSYGNGGQNNGAGQKRVAATIDFKTGNETY